MLEAPLERSRASNLSRDICDCVIRPMESMGPELHESVSSRYPRHPNSFSLFCPSNSRLIHNGRQVTKLQPCFMINCATVDTERGPPLIQKASSSPAIFVLRHMSRLVDKGAKKRPAEANVFNLLQGPVILLSSILPSPILITAIPKQPHTYNIHNTQNTQITQDIPTTSHT